MNTPAEIGPLRSGAMTFDARLDRISEYDPRSEAFSVSDILAQSRRDDCRSSHWPVTPQLDQGGQGACVGFAWAHALNSRGANLDAVFAIENIYWEAQRIDQYEGGSYPDASPISAGTSVLAGARVMRRLGFVKEFRWIHALDELLSAVAYLGPVVFGCDWRKGMSKPDPDGFVAPTGGWRGKHCVLINRLHVVRAEDGTPDRHLSWIGFQNSFGADWGLDGSARVRLQDMERLVTDMDACVPLFMSNGSLGTDIEVDS